MFAKTSVSGMVYDWVNTILLIILCITTLYPFVFLLSLSLSPDDISQTQLRLIPSRVTLQNYNAVFASKFIATGFIHTGLRLIVGVSATLLVSLFAAYPLSKKYFPHRSFWTAFIVFTMFFSGGLIPSYLLVKDLGLMNTTWALVLPILVMTFQMIIMRNFFMALPESLEESAKLDGANEIRILFSIVIPLSMPIIATVTLWTAVYHWNAWFDSMIFISDSSKQVLQVVMRKIVIEGTQDIMDINGATANPETVKAATIMTTTLPILLFYPFLQRHFIKGIMIGSLKG